MVFVRNKHAMHGLAETRDPEIHHFVLRLCLIKKYLIQELVVF